MTPLPKPIAAILAATALLAGACAGPSGAAARPGLPSAASAPGPAASTPATTVLTDPAATSAATTTAAPPPGAPGPASRNSATARPVGAASAPATTASCPQNLASELADTGPARQLVTAESAGYDTTHATVEIWQREGACWQPAGGPWPARIGQNGFSDHHLEGDGTTPTGSYAIGPVLYGNAPDPGTKEPYHRLVCGDWWDEDPTSPQYNTFQHVPCGTTPPFGAGSEALWTETQPYPSFAVIEYNTAPAVPYAGSAIFLHADTGAPTTGCVSIPLTDLDLVMRWLDPTQSPRMVLAPANEIRQF